MPRLIKLPEAAKRLGITEYQLKYAANILRSIPSMVVVHTMMFDESDLEVFAAKLAMREAHEYEADFKETFHVGAGVFWRTVKAGVIPSHATYSKKFAKRVIHPDEYARVKELVLFLVNREIAKIKRSEAAK